MEELKQTKERIGAVEAFQPNEEAELEVRAADAEETLIISSDEETGKKVIGELDAQHRAKIANELAARDAQLETQAKAQQDELLKAYPGKTLKQAIEADAQKKADIANKANELLHLAMGAGVVNEVTDDNAYSDTAKSLSDPTIGVVNSISVDMENPGYVKVRTTTGYTKRRSTADCLKYCQRMIKYLCGLDKNTMGVSEIDRVFWLVEQTFKATVRAITYYHERFGHKVPHDILAELNAGERLLTHIEKSVKSGTNSDMSIWLPR